GPNAAERAPSHASAVSPVYRRWSRRVQTIGRVTRSPQRTSGTGAVVLAEPRRTRRPIPRRRLRMAGTPSRRAVHDGRPAVVLGGNTSPTAGTPPRFPRSGGDLDPIRASSRASRLVREGQAERRNRRARSSGTAGQLCRSLSPGGGGRRPPRLPATTFEQCPI